MGKSRTRKASTWTVVGSLTAIVAVATIFIASQSDVDSAGESDSSAIELAAFGGSLNFEPVSSPKELRTRMARDIPHRTLIVEAQVEGFADGRDYLTEPGLPSGTVVMELDVTSTFAGELPFGSGGRVFMELDGPPNAGERHLQELSESLPTGTKLITYLWRMPQDGIFPGIKQHEPDAGRPLGQPLFRPYPPGLFIENPAGGGVVAPMEDLEFRNESLFEFGPNQASFPGQGVPLRQGPSNIGNT